MTNLILGVGQVTIHLRHAQSLKDKRQVIQSLTQKLKNLGFSVTECAYMDNPKQGSLGIAFVGRDASHVDRMMDDAMRLFVGPFEVIASHRDVFDYSGEETGDFLAAEEEP